MSSIAIVWSTSAAAAVTLCCLCWFVWLQVAAPRALMLRAWQWLPSSVGLLAAVVVLSMWLSRRAQREAVQLRHELTHMVRVAILGQPASVLAHELHQFSAVQQNTSASPEPRIAR